METNLSLEELNNVAEIEIVYRKKVNCRAGERPKINSSADVAALLRHYWNPDRIDLAEDFKVLFLNRANRVMQIITISEGGITGTVADPRLILATALKVVACSIILAHNHPSGALRPSHADQCLTQKIKAAAAYLDIKVLEHMIITSEGFYSFADEGLL